MSVCIIFPVDLPAFVRFRGRNAFGSSGLSPGWNRLMDMRVKYHQRNKFYGFESGGIISGNCDSSVIERGIQCACILNHAESHTYTMDGSELTGSGYRQDVAVSTCVLQVWQHWPLCWSVFLDGSWKESTY